MSNSSRCPNCQNEISDEAVFCPNCGTKITIETPADAASSSITPKPTTEKQADTMAAREVSADVTAGVCEKCGASHSPPIPSHCQDCGYPLRVVQSVSVPTGEVSERKQPRRIRKERKAEKSKRRAPPSSIFGFSIKSVLIGFIGIIVLGIAIYLLIIVDGEPRSELSACKPAEPGEDFELANQRNLSGELRQDSYFKAGEEYTIDSNSVLTIPKNVTLIIEPGARVRFGEGSRLLVEGTLLACGRQSRRILFTADTSTGSPGFWAGIEIRNADSDSVVGHATFEFGGKDTHALLWIENTDLQLEDLKFDSNEWYALSFDPSSSPRVRSSIKVENGPIGWEIRGGSMVNSQEWSADQPYIVNGVLDVDEQADLTIHEGATVMFLPGSALRVIGQLTAVGSTNSHISFTSTFDGEEETPQEPQPGDWGGVLFSGRKAESRLEHVEIRYAGGIDELTGCLWLNDAEPILADIVISDCAVFSLSTDIAADLNLEEFTFTEEDVTNWWEIRESKLEAMASQTLSTGLTESSGTQLLPVVTGVISIEKDAELVLGSGFKMLFQGDESGIYAEGDLKVNGTEDDPVVLTSWLDESVGGRGGASPGDWAGVAFYGNRPDNTVLSNIHIRYSGAGNRKERGCLWLLSADPTIVGMVISDCDTYPISSDAGSIPEMSEIDIAQNTHGNEWRIYKTTLGSRQVWRWEPLYSSDGNQIIRVVTDEIIVDNEATLILEPGSQVVFTEDAVLIVKGDLYTEGTSEKPILMTSWRDPDVFENQSGAAPGDWLGVRLENVQSNIKLSYTTIRYGGSIRHKLGCLTLINSSPVLDHVTLSHCANYPVSSDMASEPEIEQLIFENNQPDDAWAIRASSLESGFQRTWEALTTGSGRGPVPRVVLGNLTVKDGASLRLSPGVVVGFSEGTILKVTGKINVEGEPGAPVILTSWRDPEVSQGGVPQPGDWNGLRLENSHENNILDNLEIRYAGRGGGTRGAVVVVNSSARLTNLAVSDSAWYPINLSLADVVILEELDFQDNSPADAIEVRNSDLMTGGELVWAPIGNGEGQQIVRVVTGNLKIHEDASLRIDPDTVIKFDQQAGIEVRGGFIASGAVFTSIHDDDYGGETDEGSEGSPQWKGLLFIRSGNVRIADSIIRYAQNGMWMENTAPVVTSTRIEDCTEAALNADLISAPDLNGISLQGNAINGLLLRNGTLPSGKTQWGILDAGESQVIRVINSELKLGSETQLVIDPGAIIKFARGAGIVVDGQLLVGERLGERAILTSLDDDTVGGDTNNDVSTPSRGSWSGIVVNPNNTNATLALFNATIQYATTGLQIANLPEWEYEGFIISNSQHYGLSCDATSLFVANDPNLILIDNGLETESCPTPDR